jgi:hypothetical protein
MSTAQSYTITSSALTQPTSSSYTVAFTKPKLKLSGLNGPATVTMRVSFDGSDPDSTDVGYVFKDDGIHPLNVGIGNKLVFVGSNVTTDVTIEIESS